MNKAFMLEWYDQYCHIYRQEYYESIHDLSRRIELVCGSDPEQDYTVTTIDIHPAGSTL